MRAKQAKSLPLTHQKRKFPNRLNSPVGKTHLVDIDQSCIGVVHRINAFLPSFLSKYRKNGPPHIAVTTPTGSSVGLTTVRARVSAQRRKIAPPQADAG